MARTNSILTLPESVRNEIKLRHRRDGATSSVLSVWLSTQGYQVGYQPLNRFLKDLNGKIENAESIAELSIATSNIHAATGTDIDFSLLTSAKQLLGLEISRHVTAALQEKTDCPSMGVHELITAIARITAVDIASQKLVNDMRLRFKAEMEKVEQKPGMDLATIRQIREQVYGIFDGE